MNLFVFFYVSVGKRIIIIAVKHFRDAVLGLGDCLRRRPAAGDELRLPVLAGVVGEHRKPLQEHGHLGVLLLQVPAPRLPVRPPLHRLPRGLRGRVQAHQGEAATG